jgi:hypothetical protein
MEPSKPKVIPQAAFAAANAVSEHLLRVVRPLFWQVNQRILNGASAFILRFEERYVAVTAEHVIEQYLSALNAHPSLICQMGECSVSPREALIGRSQGLDLATFEVNPAMLPAMGAEAIDCRSCWPPPVVHKGDTLTLAGYLDNHRSEVALGYYAHEAWGGHGLVDEVSPRNILTIYSLADTLPARAGVPQPPLRLNLSGCSGGLGVLVRKVGGQLVWVPVGVIYRGSGAESSGDLAEFDQIYLRPLSFIRPDGTIDDPDAGWLPR